MRIGEMPRLGTAGIRKKGKASESVGVFSVEDDKETPHIGNLSAPDPSRDIQAPTGLSSFYSPVLSLQEEGYDERKSFEKGQALLQQLESLQRESLTGSLSEKTLTNIKTGLLSSQEGHSPRLRSILEAIETRAAVELAKRGQLTEKDM